MHTVRTVTCHACPWTTDISLLSASNPSVCPKCQGELFDAGTGEPFDETAERERMRADSPE